MRFRKNKSTEESIAESPKPRLQSKPPFLPKSNELRVPRVEPDCEGALSLVVVAEAGTDPKTVPKSGLTALEAAALPFFADETDFFRVSVAQLPPNLPLAPVTPRLDGVAAVFRVPSPPKSLFSPPLSLSDAVINVSKPNFSTVSTKRMPVNACAQ